MPWLAVALLLAGGAVWVAYHVQISAARERVASGSRIAQTACGPIEYAVVGTGPPILVVHGAGGGFDQALGIAAPLVAAGLRVVAPSRFGYLRTPLPADASAAAQADAHACLLDVLGIDRVAVLGASAGAPSSLQFALRHPGRTRALVLLVPAAYAPRASDAASVKTPRGTQFLFDTALRSDLLFWMALKLAPGAVDHALLATPPDIIRHATPQERARVRQIRRHILPVSARRPGLLNDATVISSIPPYPLEQIGAPTLAISVADDLFGTWDAARHAATHIPGARFRGYPSGGHVWVGHHDEVLAEITAFLQ
jgi:pimeloyl-ACP methyl ester carboxylesterase